MSAGSGVVHSEMNPSRDAAVHFLQIWIIPRERGTTPGYDQRAFPVAPGLQLVASGDPADGVLTVKQDVRVFRAVLEPGESAEHVVPDGRRLWLHVARGAVTAAGSDLRDGDGLATDEAGTLAITATEPAELLLFDLA